MKRYWRRKIISFIMSTITFSCAIITLVPLILILLYLVIKGISAINLDFFIQLPKPVGEPGGGMANAIVGSIILLSLASLIGLLIGIMAGVYLAEFGNNWMGWNVRFFADLLNGVPSIVVGIFVYSIIVLPMKRFSAIAGGIALGIMMIPMVARTTEEMIRLVPVGLREASLALGVPQWKTTIRIVLRTAIGGIVTGAMVALARVAGETAPLLFTAFGNRFWHSGMDQPIAALTLQIFAYAISPFEDWHAQAWAGALVLITMILIVSMVARFFIGSRDTGR